MGKVKVAEKVQEFKAWYKSKTIIGLAISSISGVVFALTSGKVDVQGAVDTAMTGSDELANSADNLIAGVMFFIGQAVAIYGRLKAKVGLK
jgi:hypothetical protein